MDMSTPVQPVGKPLKRSYGRKPECKKALLKLVNQGTYKDLEMASDMKRQVHRPGGDTPILNLTECAGQQGVLLW